MPPGCSLPPGGKHHGHTLRFLFLLLVNCRQRVNYLPVLIDVFRFCKTVLFQERISQSVLHRSPPTVFPPAGRAFFQRRLTFILNPSKKRKSAFLLRIVKIPLYFQFPHSFNCPGTILIMCRRKRNMHCKIQCIIHPVLENSDWQNRAAAGAAESGAAAYKEIWHSRNPLLPILFLRR